MTVPQEVKLARHAGDLDDDGHATVGGVTGANYLVGSAQAGLSAEIVVGTTPGGELGGTWASPTVDATHSGSAHSDAIAKAIVDAKGDLIAGTAADTVARLGVGADGYVLTAASGETPGMKWAAAAATGATQLASITAASAAIANTETVVVSASLAANTVTAGMSFRIRAAGVGTTGLTPGVHTFRVRIGTTTLTGNIPTTVAPPANASVTAQPFSFEALLTVRTAGAGGTIIGECLAIGDDVATGLFTLLVDLSATVATVALDTTAAKLLELTFQSGAADSNATFHVATIEALSSGALSSGANGALLGLKAYEASDQTFNQTSATLGDADATNLIVTFTPPASGNVLVRLTGVARQPSAVGAGARAYWGLRESTTIVAGPAFMLYAASIPAGNVLEATSVAFYLTGVSAGSHSYKWAIAGDGTYGGGLYVTTGSPAVMEVWAA